MHINKSILLFLVLMSQFCQLGCRKKKENEERAQVDQIAGKKSTYSNLDKYGLAVITGEDVGPIWCGMSKEEALQTIGRPEKVADDGRSLLYPSKGFSLFVPPTKGVQVINCYSKMAAPPIQGFQDFQGKTKEGIRIGANLSKVLAIYGEPTKKSVSGRQTQLHYQELGVTFFLLDDRLMQFIILPSTRN